MLFLVFFIAITLTFTLDVLVCNITNVIILGKWKYRHYEIKEYETRMFDVMMVLIHNVSTCIS